ncbi:hypothetical protein V8E36_002040 [Tilletia maclaganii]
MFALTTSPSRQQDPTSLSKRQKWLMLLTLCLASFTSNLFGAAHLTSFPQIAAVLDATIAQVANSIGVGILGLGVGPLLWNPLSSALGRRPVYLAAWTLFLPCCAWCAASRSFDSFAAARFFGGFCASVAQTLPAATISEVWSPEVMGVTDLAFPLTPYRGTAIAAWTVAMIIGPMLAPLVNAALITRQSWSWMYWLLLILAGLELALLILFVPETQTVVAPGPRDGPAAAATITAAPIQSAKSDDVEKAVGAETPETASSEEAHKLGESATKDRVVQGSRRLGMAYYPWKEPVRFGKALVRPFYQAIYFPIISLALWNGWIFCSAIGISVLLPEEFLKPPFSYTPVVIGTLFLACIIGAVPGKFRDNLPAFPTLTPGPPNHYALSTCTDDPVGGWVADITVTTLERRSRHRRREPELRLPALVIPTATVFIGAILFGDGLKQGQSWVEPTIGAGIYYFGLASVQGVVQTYLVECDLPQAGSTITLYNLIKNAWGFAAPFFIPEWAASGGIRTSFIAQAVISLGSGALLVAVLMPFGRKIREAQVRTSQIRDWAKYKS